MKEIRITKQQHEELAARTTGILYMPADERSKYSSGMDVQLKAARVKTTLQYAIRHVDATAPDSTGNPRIRLHLKKHE